MIFYKFFYSPLVNLLVRNALKFFNKIFNLDFDIPVSGKLHLTVTGNTTMKLWTNQTNYVSRLLFWKGVDAFEFTSIFRQLIQNDHVFFDIGANIGYYTILGRLIRPNLKVYSFEPSPSPFLFLKKNIRLNKLEGIEAYDYALSNKNGEANFFVNKSKKYRYLQHYLGGTDALYSTRKNNISKIRVTSTTLDTFIVKHNITRVDLLKIDTEATEDLILQGAYATIQKFKPIIICEVLFQKIEKSIEEKMRQHKYLFFNHTGKGLLPVDTLIRKFNDGYNNYFFVHPSKLFQIQGFLNY